MNKIILHISDLHVTLHEALNGSKNTKINSWLNTNPTDENCNAFIKHFTDFVKDKYATHEKYLIISGDVANEAEKEEYEYAEKYIALIVKELQIHVDNILLIPGDHDIHRDTIKNAIRQGKANGDTRPSYLYNESKYINFAPFYQKIKKKDFPINSTLVDTVSINNEILLIGLNSNHYIDYQTGLGKFNLEQLQKELTEVCDKNKKLIKIAVFHHNLVSNYENKLTGQWDEENRKHVIAEFERFEIKCILNGNEHTRGSEKIRSTEIYVSDSGAFTTIKEQGSFKCYEIIGDANILKFSNNLFTIQQRNAVDDIRSGYWANIDPKAVREHDEFILFKKNIPAKTEQIDFLNEIVTVEISETATAIDTQTSKISQVYYSNTEYSEKLYQIIKNKNLFHTGHFHWSETSRAHNWIDISKILEDNSDLLFVKNAIIDVIEKCNLSDKFDFIIGLGTEGNIISTRASVKYNKPYSLLPYSYRYDEHNNFERQLNFTNNGEYKTVLVITDVVNDGRTIRKLIAKREKDFFSKVDKVIVVSLIYTGDLPKADIGILNSNQISEFDSKNDEIVNNIEFYSVLNLKVEKCPYKDEFRSSCLIYKDGLSCVHLFYDEEKAIGKLSNS